MQIDLQLHVGILREECGKTGCSSIGDHNAERRSGEGEEQALGQFKLQQSLRSIRFGHCFNQAIHKVGTLKLASAYIYGKRQ